MPARPSHRAPSSMFIRRLPRAGPRLKPLPGRGPARALANSRLEGACDMDGGRVGLLRTSVAARGHTAANCIQCKYVDMRGFSCYKRERGRILTSATQRSGVAVHGSASDDRSPCRTPPTVPPVHAQMSTDHDASPTGDWHVRRRRGIVSLADRHGPHAPRRPCHRRGQAS
jgi:hypothetical protein